MTTYQLDKLGATFGARVSGIDLTSPLDEPTASRLVSDLRTYRLLVVPDQKLDHADHIRVSRAFGPLDIYPVERYVVKEFPEVLTISNIFENGEPIGLYDGDDQEEWHTDYSWKENISSASLLYSVVAPQQGGDTIFADTTAAYDELSDSAKTRLRSLRAVHSMAHLVSEERKINPYKAPLSPEELARTPDIDHPLVRVHPVTEQRSLLLGSMIISGIVGLAQAEAAALLAELHAHATADRYIYRHHWSVGDLVIWDNHATMHTRTPCDHVRNQRLLYRTTVL